MRAISWRSRLCWLALAVSVAAAQVNQSVINKQVGVISFTKPEERDPILQHAKEIYVLYGCAYCHGVDLRTRNGEAADLLHSKLVGQDDNGDLIGKVLREGIPQTPKLSPMPQFSDLSEREIADIVRWIHYARQQGRYRELTQIKEATAGDAIQGGKYFEQKCVSCHSAKGDFAHIGSKYGFAELRDHILRPAFMTIPQSWKVDQLHDQKMAAARQRHGSLLENYSSEEVADLTAYLQTLK